MPSIGWDRQDRGRAPRFSVIATTLVGRRMASYTAKMQRRQFVAAVAATPLLAYASSGPAAAASRVRPGDPAWPSAAAWDRLRQQTGGRLIEVHSPLGVCRDAPTGIACRDFFRAL